jgi:hypothetical protein
LDESGDDVAWPEAADPVKRTSSTIRNRTTQVRRAGGRCGTMNVSFTVKFRLTIICAVRVLDKSRRNSATTACYEKTPLAVHRLGGRLLSTTGR